MCRAKKMEALGELSAGVAHDFNNILMIIDGYTRMTVENLNDEQTARACLEKIILSVGRGASLTRKLLSFSRKNVVAEEVFNVSAFLEDQKELLMPLVGATIRLDIQTSGAFYIKGAQDSLAQSLINLVTNSRDAMPEGGMIQIKLTACEPASLPEDIPAAKPVRSYLCLSVVDDGSGMSPATLEKATDPFFTTKDPGKGTGLGLSIVYSMIRRMNGSMQIDSVPGRGTSVRLYLPEEEKPAQSKAKESLRKSKPSATGLVGRTVLLVEDEEDLRLVVGRMLAGKGLTVLSAANGNEALLAQHDHTGRIDFLLTDIVMPELDGIRLEKLLREIRPDMRTIFMSGYPGTGPDKQDKRDLPANIRVLAKPVDINHLVSAMQDTLEKTEKKGARPPQWAEDRYI